VSTDPRKIYISTDYKNSWTEIYSISSKDLPEVTGTPLQDFMKFEYPLAGYAGKTVFFKFEATTIDPVNNSYWILDNFCVSDKVTTPMISSRPVSVDFGGVQITETSETPLSVFNMGSSILKVKSIRIEGEGFSLNDGNQYPVEVTDLGNTWAYTIGNSGSSVYVSVVFKPSEVRTYTGKVIVTYGLFGDQTYEIAMKGEGLSCSTALVAEAGRNRAPGQNSWFKYTADKFSIVQVTSCDSGQQADLSGWDWDTYLEVYSGCNGDLVAFNDDMMETCEFNWGASGVQLAVNAGESIYIFWKKYWLYAPHANEGFYFNINVTYPVDGDVCENAIPLTLPVVNHFGTTVGFNDDYNNSPCSPFSNYMDGNDKVYTITLAEESYLNANLMGAYGSVHVLDVCPKEELDEIHCKAFTGGPNGGQFRTKVTAGTYYVVISTWAPPQTVDYLLNMSWESGSAVDNGNLMGSLSVYPNPATGKFTVNITKPKAADLTIELVNFTGQVVYRQNVKAAYSYINDIDASTFAKGIYYLKVNDGTSVKIEKVVLQ
jgi:hypothetical protein